MKVENSIYSRSGIVNQTKIQPPEVKPIDRHQDQVAKTTHTNTIKQLSHKNEIINSKQVIFNAQNISKLTKVSDVLTDQERSMLEGLFPTSGVKWGVNAYKSSSNPSEFSSVGMKLNLTS